MLTNIYTCKHVPVLVNVYVNIERSNLTSKTSRSTYIMNFMLKYSHVEFPNTHQCTKYIRSTKYM